MNDHDEDNESDRLYQEMNAITAVVRQHAELRNRGELPPDDFDAEHLLVHMEQVVGLLLDANGRDPNYSEDDRAEFGAAITDLLEYVRMALEGIQRGYLRPE